MCLPHEEMELRRAFADFNKLRRGFLVQFFSAGAVSRDGKYIKITQMSGFLRPERLQRARCIGPALGKEVTKSEQMPGLERGGLVADHRLERWNSFKKFILPVKSQSNVQPHTGHLRHKALSVMQSHKSLSPL